MPRQHEIQVKENATELFEIAWLTVQQIHERTDIPVSTLNYWRRKENWTKTEQTPLNLAMAEYKRVISKTDYSDRDFRKLKNLKEIIDEYSEQRSQFMIELQLLLDHLKKSNAEKNAALAEVTELINKHTGAGLKMKEKAVQKKANDFRNISFKFPEKT